LKSFQKPWFQRRKRVAHKHWTLILGITLVEFMTTLRVKGKPSQPQLLAREITKRLPNPQKKKKSHMKSPLKRFRKLKIR